MYIYLDETKAVHLLQNLVYEPNTTNVKVNDINIECETTEIAEKLYNGIISAIRSEDCEIVSVLSDKFCRRGYHTKPRKGRRVKIATVSRDF